MSIKSTLFFLTISMVSITASGQTTGIFGGNGSLDGDAGSNSRTYGKWIRFGEFTLNQNWSNFSCSIDFYPVNANHGDSRQQINICFRNSNSGVEASQDIGLISFSGIRKSIKDVKVVHYDGSGVSSNKFAIWIQMGISYLSSVPFEYRVAKTSNASYVIETTNQPYYTSITSAGTTYDVNSRFGMQGDTFEVDGTIRSKEIKVEAEPWPDYVFADNYELRPLSEIKSYVIEKHHLPDVPSAEQVAEEGINLGEMNAILLKKIEELTLHVIQQNEKLSSQDEIIQSLTNRISNLEKK